MDLAARAVAPTVLAKTELPEPEFVVDQAVEGMKAEARPLEAIIHAATSAVAAHAPFEEERWLLLLQRGMAIFMFLFVSLF